MRLTGGTQPHRSPKGAPAWKICWRRASTIYGVNTGVGGNVGISARAGPDGVASAQHPQRILSCATGQPLPRDVVRAATLLRIATFVTGASAVRNELVDALANLLEPRRDAGGAALWLGRRQRRSDALGLYRARARSGPGTAELQGRILPAPEALAAAGMAPLRFAPKEALALINGTTMMTAVAALLWQDSFRVLRGLLGAVALFGGPRRWKPLPCRSIPGFTNARAIPASLPWLRICANCWPDPATRNLPAAKAATRCDARRRDSDRCGRHWLIHAPPSNARINSANDNPLVDAETGTLYQAGNFYGGHIARLLDTWKLDFSAS